ncbi:MAG: alanine:cation symporter family protein [Oscillospiraceae bacterium]|nr:alanine:cation symporter family protein [Candidatus Equicaccousia limihippi]
MDSFAQLLQNLGNALGGFFGSLESFLYPIVCNINEYLSSYILIILLIGVGLWFSIKTRFVQVRCFGEGMKKVFGNLKIFGKKEKSGMSSFQALATAIAAQVGTGNIIGASGAILIGGPGAIFWMWVIAFFGMATIYAEATLAIKTREVDADGTIKGGPVYYIRQAFKGGFGKFLAGFFAVAIILALGFFGCMVQSNSIGSTIENAFGIPSFIMGFILVVICAAIFLGNVQRLASVTEKIVPIMAAIFLLGGLVVLAVNIKSIPQTFGLIFKYAFVPQAILGGAFGAAIKAAISQGAKRGLFSNEAGMGSTPHAHAQANVKEPHEQGVVAMIGVFIDTFVVLTLNALVIISSLYTDGGILEGGVIPEGIDKTNLAQTAFGTGFGKIFGPDLGMTIGSMFVAVCLFFFAFSTILGWNLFGKINIRYMFGKKYPKFSVIAYAVLALGFVFVGTVASNDLVWELTDMFNNLMVIPNALALFALTGMVVASTKRRNGSPLLNK